MKTDPELVTAYFQQWSDEHRAVVECTTGWYCQPAMRSGGVL
jgi:hypothetical protein